MFGWSALCGETVPVFCTSLVPTGLWPGGYESVNADRLQLETFRRCSLNPLCCATTPLLAFKYSLPISILVVYSWCQLRSGLFLLPISAMDEFYVKQWHDSCYMRHDSGTGLQGQGETKHMIRSVKTVSAQILSSQIWRRGRVCLIYLQEDV